MTYLGRTGGQWLEAGLDETTDEAEADSGWRARRAREKLPAKWVVEAESDKRPNASARRISNGCRRFFRRLASPAAATPRR